VATGLGRAIEGEIIPRLLASHRVRRLPAAPVAAAAADVEPAADVVEEFTRILLDNDAHAADAFVEAMLAQQIPLETICLDLMSCSARRLGDLWAADRCHFTDVTLAVGRLQGLLRHFGDDDGPGMGLGRRALLVSAPGEQHSFGALMVAEFLRHAGWDVSGEIGSSAGRVVASVRDEWFAVVGFSLSSEQHVGSLASLIRAIRRASRNHGVVVLVGGSVFLEHPRFVTVVGADATATDARQAVAQAEDAVADHGVEPNVARGGV
jgi:methanogenic corrinoid protein MtbC1